MTDRSAPDTGFKLRPLIQEVLADSESTEPDALALEVLARIKAYDHETALYQALRVLVRETWRPKFIPIPQAAHEPAPKPRTPDNPPPERDGRQWMPTFVPGERARTWNEVRTQRRPDEQIVAEHRAEIDRAQYERPDMQAAQGPPVRRQPSPSSRPKASPKVAAIREAWRKTLRQRIPVETGHKFFGDCTIADLQYAAGLREQQAQRTQARADELRKLAGIMGQHRASTLKELPAEMLAELESTLEQAAA